MRTLLPLRVFALVILVLETVSIPVEAIPLAELRWGTCPFGPDSIDRFDPASTHETISVTARGLSGTVREVMVTLSIWAGGSQVSDAWRFDPGGCEGARLYTTQAAPASPCPRLRGFNAVEAVQVDYTTFPPGGWSGGREFVRYRAGFVDAVTANPATTYTIVQFEFDHPNGILGGVHVEGSCGCLERPLCVSLVDLQYVDTDGTTHGNFFPLIEGIHWNDPANTLACPMGPDLCDPHCGWEQDTVCVASNPTPVGGQSWGRVKANYR